MDVQKRLFVSLRDQVICVYNDTSCTWKYKKGLFVSRWDHLICVYNHTQGGRGGEIWTHGPCLPKAVLYQAELHPDEGAYSIEGQGVLEEAVAKWADLLTGAD